MKYDSCILQDHQRLRQVGNPTIGNGTDQDHRLAPEPRSPIPKRIQSRNWTQCCSLSTASDASGKCTFTNPNQVSTRLFRYSESKSESKSYHAHPSGYTTAQESGLCITVAEERDAALLYTDGRLHGSKIVWSVCKAG